MMTSTLLFVFLLIQTVKAEVIAVEKPFTPIEPTFPSNLENSRLGFYNLHPEGTPQIRCAALCFQHPDCHLYCYKGNECHIFYAFITTSWTGSADDQFGFTACYTSWYFEPNLSPGATATQDSNPYGLGPELGLRGYYCCSVYDCSVTKITSNPWYKVDLGQSRNVSYIAIKFRDSESDFSDVEVRLGDSSSFQSNPQFYKHVGPAPPKKSHMKMVPPGPMSGRYLSFQSLIGSGALAICALVIVGE